MFFPDCCTVIRGTTRLVTSAPRTVAGAAILATGLLSLVSGPPSLVAGAPRCSQVHPKFTPALQGVPKPIAITPMVLLYQLSEMPVTPVLVIRDLSYSEDRLECPPRVGHSPEIDASKFTLHILSDTPGGSQRLQYILLMMIKQV